MTDPVTELYQKLFSNYFWKNHLKFIIWKVVVWFIFGLTGLSMITVVWFVDWWWKLGVSMLVVCYALHHLNQAITYSIFENWVNNRKR